MASPPPLLLECAQRAACACGQALAAAEGASLPTASSSSPDSQRRFDVALRLVGAACQKLVGLGYATSTADDVLLRKVLDTRMVERIRWGLPAAEYL
jgi:hypothetical protein